MSVIYFKRKSGHNWSKREEISHQWTIIHIFQWSYIYSVVNFKFTTLLIKPLNPSRMNKTSFFYWKIDLFTIYVDFRFILQKFSDFYTFKRNDYKFIFVTRTNVIFWKDIPIHLKIRLLKSLCELYLTKLVLGAGGVGQWDPQDPGRVLEPNHAVQTRGDQGHIHAILKSSFFPRF